MQTVIVREVGPRDGLQMAKDVMPTQLKLRWIVAMVEAGVRHIELGSFVPAASLPQLADSAEVLRQVQLNHPQVHANVLAPNLRGVQDAVAAGAKSIIVPVSASEAHSRANVRRSREEQVAQFQRMAEWIHSQGHSAPRIEAAVSTAFGCSLQGEVPEDEVIRLSGELARAGADVVTLADTLGYASPSQVRRLVRAVKAEIGAEKFGALHLHDTLGTALANVVAGLEEGVRAFDGALGGLGGCPYAPGSVGNVSTEDLAYLLESEGFDTGIDLEPLLAARAVLAEAAPNERLYGRVATAGVPRTYRPAKQRPHASTVFVPPQEVSAAGAAASLAGVRVIEFSHMVMGPSCGLVLADLGADVIKVEPGPDGDNTRRLTGLGSGFFATFNRNKRSLCVDFKTPAGLALVRKLVAQADVVLENFRPGAMDQLGLGYEDLSRLNPRLVYCACKGFLPGPYEHRAALDEVVQMMGGLAYMTGRPGQPARAGASVNDIMGGVFGALAILAALRERERTGKGSLVQSGLFETNMMFMAPHMARAAIEGRDPLPFGDPAVGRPWPIYDVFETADASAQVFVGVVTERQWRDFCGAFKLDDLLQDPDLSTAPGRVQERSRILARVRPIFASIPKAVLMAKLEALGLPFAPIARPTELFQDPHLVASGGLLPVDLTGVDRTPVQSKAGLPALPVILSNIRPGLRRQPPRVGEHSVEVARLARLTEEEINALVSEGVLVHSVG